MLVMFCFKMPALNPAQQLILLYVFVCDKSNEKLYKLCVVPIVHILYEWHHLPLESTWLHLKLFCFKVPCLKDV